MVKAFSISEDNFHNEFFKYLKFASTNAVASYELAKFARDFFWKINSSEYIDLCNYCGDFWPLIRESLVTTSIINVSKLYDTDPRVLSVPRILKTIEENDGFLAVDSSQLASDIQITSTQDVLVKKIIVSRGHIYAHRGVTFEEKFPVGAIEGRGMYYLINPFEVVELAQRALDILNRYNKLFGLSQQIHLSDRHKVVENEQVLEIILKFLNQQKANLGGEPLWQLFEEK